MLFYKNEIFRIFRNRRSQANGRISFIFWLNRMILVNQTIGILFWLLWLLRIVTMATSHSNHGHTQFPLLRPSSWIICRICGILPIQILKSQPNKLPQRYSALAPTLLSSTPTTWFVQFISLHTNFEATNTLQ